MKKFTTFLFILAALPMMAADLEVVVSSTSNGRVDDDTIDLASVSAGDKITVELWLRNLDFTLAGFEGEFQFPTFLSLIDTTTVGTANPPWSTSLPSSQELPADASGNPTAVTFRNDRGYGRVGAIITDPGSRPTTGDHLLATFCLVVGRDYDGSLASRNLPSCTSAEETIRFLACNTGAANCHLIADDSANAVAVNYSNADLEISVIDSGTTIYKGDSNNSGSFTLTDISSCVQCIIFGDNDINPNCPINDDDAEEWLIRLDMTCNGSASATDISATVRRAVGLDNRPAGKTLAFNAVDSKGMLDMPGGDNAAGVVAVTMAVQGQMEFGQPELSQEGITDGWQVMGQFNARTNNYKYVLFHNARTNQPIPNVRIPYTAKEARVAVADVEAVGVDGRAARHMPSLNRMDLRND